MDLMRSNENYAFLIAIHVTPLEKSTTRSRVTSGAKIFIENEKTIVHDPGR